jgi:hypothetical protein
MKLNREIIHPLYRRWKTEDRHMKKVTIETTTLFGENMVVPQTLDSKFIPVEIRDYIYAYCESQHVFKARIGDKPITIYIIAFEEDDFEKWVRRMLMWLSIGYDYSNAMCANELTIYLYLTPFEKHLPSDIHETIGPLHVNTGMAFRCSKVG